MDKSVSRAIVLNLGDGLTTSLSYLLPMVLFGGTFVGKALIIGGIGGATSMAFNLDDSEDGHGTLVEFVAAFVAAGLGGILPALSYIALTGHWRPLGASLVVAVGVGTILWVKARTEPLRTASWQVGRSVLPAMVIVTLLSLIH